jgi:hypothetical protein
MFVDFSGFFVLFAIFQLGSNLFQDFAKARLVNFDLLAECNQFSPQQTVSICIERFAQIASSLKQQRRFGKLTFLVAMVCVQRANNLKNNYIYRHIIF